MLDIRQTRRYGEYLRENGWIVERINNVNYFIKRLPLLGSILKLQRPEKIDLGTVDKLARKYRTFQLIIEPKTEKDAVLLAANGFKLSKNPFLPSKTLQIDLTKSEKEILSAFKKDARQAVKRGEGNITKPFREYSSVDEIKIWRNAWKNSVKFDRYVPSVNELINLHKSFPQHNSLFLASHNIVGSIIGGVLFTTSSHGGSNYITYYWYGFTNKEGRSSLSQYSLLYHGILWAKKHGYKIFDFEGIYDPRFPNKSWLGFTHFKRSFGGYEVTYPGCYNKLTIKNVFQTKTK